MRRSKSFIATPPGATVKEQLLDREMNQKEFAARMGMSEKHISRLINGDVQLTLDTARKLEMVLGIPAHVWCNLEQVYREKLLLVEEENAMDTDIEIAKKMPYKEMVSNGWINSANSWSEKVINLRKYFEVAQLEYITGESILDIACRRLSFTEKGDFALAAWAQQAKLVARRKTTEGINIQHLQNQLSTIRSMTVEDPEHFCPQLDHTLAACGIALVYLPHIGGSFLHGATFYDGKKIVMGMTVRGKDADKFWFSLFHEIAHVVLGHIGKAGGTTEQDERDADTFAKNTLIPLNEFQEFVNDGEFDKVSIINFSRRVGIDPGIVVGRLQKEGYIHYSWFNDLKKKYILK